ncbi:MAG: xanthine dehydrogenase family protein subunit M [Woeseiaceae bacterium]|nr:xanthine dehydrogenase family protein subunit M [Woeseiaceae bacterium]
MYAFDYHRPRSLEEARRLLTDGESARLLAGGMTLLPAMKLRLSQSSDLIDLAGIETLRGIAVDAGQLTIGAMTPHADVEASADVRAFSPALAAVARGIGDPQVRHRGTLGGSLANNDPAADYPAAVLGMGATIVTDRREIDADAFFLDLFETALEPNEIIVGVRFPQPRRAGYAKFPNPASRYAIVGVFVAATASSVRVAVTGAGPVVFRHHAMEEALSRDFSAAALEGVRTDPQGLNEDLHASAEYRAQLIGVMAARAVEAAGG